MAAVDYDLLFDACRELFGPEVDVCTDFLNYLQPDGIRSAFRRRAKETHPDHCADKLQQLQDEQAAHFCRVRSAYDTLSDFLRQRDREAHTPVPRQRPKHRPQSSRPGSFSDECPHPIPQRPLQLGRYLYHRKVITFRELLQALTWQRASRGTLGLIAREWGWMTAGDVFKVLSAQMPGRFGEKAVRLGVLDPARVKMILLEQKIRHKRIGQYFVQCRLLTPQELDFFLKELRLHNSRFA